MDSSHDFGQSDTFHIPTLYCRSDYPNFRIGPFPYLFILLPKQGALLKKADPSTQLLDGLRGSMV